MKSFLLEIGTEEIPARFIPSGINSLKAELSKFLYDASIDFGDVHAFATPRRLAILIKNVSEKQKDREIEVMGPPKKIAVDEKGNYTKAALGFAKTHNADIKDLKIVRTERGEYIAAIIEKKGLDTKDFLAAALPGIITSVQFPKSMRWGSNTIRFARPVRWIVALFGSEIIPFELDGLKSGNLTRGHRFLSQGIFKIDTPESYKNLLEKNFVIPDHEERKGKISDGIRKTESTTGCNVREDKELLDTVTFLVEYPTVIFGDFDPKYLILPKELLITVMKSHQKYFSTEDKNGNLLPHFLLISNTGTENNESVKKGAERVLKARLEDARFYYNEDQKRPLWDYIEKLKDVTFHEKLGSLYDKVERISFLCSHFADLIGLKSKEKILRAAMLSKADLVTGIVREFPELQGYTGMIYAINSGEDNDVALALYEHYMPRFAGDSLPSSKMSAIVSLSDKIDSIASFFFIGLIPTGSEDPFALRRQAIGIINILQAYDFPVTIDTVIDKALQGLECFPPAKGQIKDNIIRFFEQRLEGILLDEGYGHDMIDSVLSTGKRNIKDIKNRLEILSSVMKNPEFPSLLTAAKRVYNILGNKKAGGVNKELFKEPLEKELYNTALVTEARLADKDFQALFALEGPINSFFDSVLVMDKNPEIKANRLALLYYVRKIFGLLCDFSKIVTSADTIEPQET